MDIPLYPSQQRVLDKIKTGSILRGGVGSGKSITALSYFFKFCGGSFTINSKGVYKTPDKPRDLYIITTAKKRDDKEWEKEAARFAICNERKDSIVGIKLYVDSWNNIVKYVNVIDAFFIFDEQRAISLGTWGKSLIKISKKNDWILLSATPGDTWIDYMPIFIANGFYKNKTDFIINHVIYSPYTKFPKIDRFVGIKQLEMNKEAITIYMDSERKIERQHEYIKCKFDKDKYKMAWMQRWNMYDDEPIQEIGKLMYILRRVTNEDKSRQEETKNKIIQNKRIIIFYNFTYELEILREICESLNVPYSEWNGQKHQKIIDGERWAYLVQYSSGCEGWNCIKTNVILFYSLTHSYKMLEQAKGRIDRINTPYKILKYYYMISNSQIDRMIKNSIDNKKEFNERKFRRYLEKL